MEVHVVNTISFTAAANVHGFGVGGSSRYIIGYRAEGDRNHHVSCEGGDCVRRAAMALQPLLRLGSADEGSRVVVAGSRSKREFT